MKKTNSQQRPPQESDIIIEGKTFWILKIKTGHYEILKNTITHSVRVATIHYSDDPEKALKIAMQHYNKREKEAEEESKALRTGTKANGS